MIRAGDIWKHVKSGREYKITGHGTFQIGQFWVKAVYYREIDSTGLPHGQSYGRELREFQQSFALTRERDY